MSLAQRRRATRMRRRIRFGGLVTADFWCSSISRAYLAVQLVRSGVQSSAQVSLRIASEVSCSYVPGLRDLLCSEKRHSLHRGARAIGNVMGIRWDDASFLHVCDDSLRNDFGAAIDLFRVAAVGVDAGPNKGDEVEKARKWR